MSTKNKFDETNFEIPKYYSNSIPKLPLDTKAPNSWKHTYFLAHLTDGQTYGRTDGKTEFWIGFG